ncbi:MAG: DNA-directed RNA polymerase subunit P [Aigarchaeota archaeon]|nr:DNA-directed RNA polymerase subunit P [Aigarchaeota archaeon]MDW8092826.1 DNA-directed RNA polymerase subunit P [Nitrososphaerota archaeon]
MTGDVVYYQCVYCKRVFSKDQLPRIIDTRCPVCGFNVIKKHKSGMAKLIVTSKLSEEQRLLLS